MKYSIFYDHLTGKFYATLLSGEIPNCYGQGNTATDAVINLILKLK
jgi:predicted RNase H-like HicB family nuclease